MNLTFAITLCFLALNLLVGIVAGKDITDMKEFALSKGYFGRFALISTITATFIGGGMIIGNSEKTYTYGIGYLLAVTGACFQFLFAAKFLAPRIIKFHTAKSIGDFVFNAYGKGAKLTVGLAWLVFCIGLVSTQFLAIGKVLWTFLGVDLTTGIVLGASIVIFYCYYGGIRSVIMTDVMQFLVMMTIIPVLCYLGLQKHPSWSEFVASIPAQKLTLFGTLSPLNLLILFATFFLGEALFPPFVQRILIANKERTSTSVTNWSSLFSTFLCLCGGLLGLIALSLDQTLDPSNVLYFLFHHPLNPLLESLFIIGFTSVIMSSVDSNLNSVASTIVYDIAHPFWPPSHKPVQDKRFLSYARTATLAVGGVAILLAIASQHLPILDILLFAYKFWGPIVLVPLTAVLFSIKISRRGFYTSALSGLTMTVLWEYLKPTALQEVDSFIPGLLANLAVFLCFWLITAPKKRRVSTKVSRSHMPQP